MSKPKSVAVKNIDISDILGPEILANIDIGNGGIYITSSKLNTCDKTDNSRSNTL